MKILITIITIYFLSLLYGLTTVTQSYKKDVLDKITPTPIMMNGDSLFEYIQQYRLRNGYNLYQRSEKLCKFAAVRATEIQTDWSHNGFHTRTYFIDPPLSLGENLSRGFSNEQLVLTAWLNSPTHRENLERNFKYSCIVCKNNYCAHEFSDYPN